MIILITGTSCTGKTFISQKLMEKYNIPYMSIDHIKMGLIRSGNTKISVYDDESLMPYLWNIVKEIVKTAIENNQNLIIEGVYIPFDYKEYFTDIYLKHIKYYNIIFSKEYINNNFDTIIKYANEIEKRQNDFYIDKDIFIKENEENLLQCKKYNNPYILINNNYLEEIKNCCQI